MDSFAPATPEFDADGRLMSRRYGDIYWSRQGAPAQAAHVFLAGNRLPERFGALPEGGAFTVGETGFGAGLNFLSTLRLFREKAPAQTRLHFLSVEKHPLTPQAVAQALAPWPQLNDAGDLDALLAQWPPLLPGTFQLRFALGLGRTATLTLLHGEAVETFAAADAGAGAEAWFFDGFSPQKNPDMWKPEIFAQAARLSAPGATFATWTVGEQVRIGLTAAGFAWERMPGFGQKMEMLAGKLSFCAHEPCAQAQGDSPLPALAHKARERKTALVIGAGIAGCAAARALAERGVRVVLADPCGIGQKSSGNAQGIVQPMLSGVDTAEGDLARAAFWFATRRLAQLAPDLWHPTGTLWWREPKNLEVFRRRVKKLGWPGDLLREVTAAEAGALAGIPVPSDAIYCPAAGWVSPARLCARLAEHPLITCEQRSVAQVSGDEADVVVICAAERAPELAAPLASLPKLRLTPVRGQTIGVPAVPASAPLKTVLHFGHYVVPAEDGRHTVGATHQSGDWDVACRAADEAELLAGINANLPVLAGAWEGAARTTRAGLRCHADDRLPVVGFLPGCPNVALITALGPRGISLGLLGAEVLAAQLFGEPLPVPAALAVAMDPARLGRL